MLVARGIIESFVENRLMIQAQRPLKKDWLFFVILIWLPLMASAVEPGLFRIEVRDSENGWPVPLIQLRTVNHQCFVSDNAGVIAIDQPDLFGTEVYFHILGHGYEVPADGFGYRGVRITPQVGGTYRLEVQRSNIAKRLGRLTGQGLFAHSQRFGEYSDWTESPVAGCDSVQMVIYQGRPFWNWGDTLLMHYPLGNFHMTGAHSTGAPVTTHQPPIKPRYEYLLTAQRRPKGVAPIPGEGPTWLTGYAALKDQGGIEHLVALYRKIEPPMTVYETGLCEWNPQTQEFETKRKLWHKSDGAPEPKLLPVGHPLIVEEEGNRWLYLCDPLPKFRCAATYEAYLDSTAWQTVQAPASLARVEVGQTVKPHSGSVAWHPYRQRWVTVFMQAFGEPSVFGELWYAESDRVQGPWGPAIKVLTHQNYTFYNPRLWGEFTTQDSPILLFEGTYTEQFTKGAQATPRYDYNQMLYRIDLDDPRLKPAQTPPIAATSNP